VIVFIMSTGAFISVSLSTRSLRSPAVFSPTSVVLVGGLAIARVGYNVWLKFVWPLLLALLVAAALIVGIAATLH